MPLRNPLCILDEDDMASDSDICVPTQQSVKAYVDERNYFGIAWNESTDAYERRGELAGVAAGSSPGDSALPIQAAMRRCVISDAGVVQYYLDPTDSTKKLSGEASVLTGADGQVMVEIPKFYYRYSYASNVHKWDISFLPLAGFDVHPAFIKNGVEVDYRYIGAYEGVLYDNSESVYTSDYNQVAAHAATFAVPANTITAGAGTPYALLQAGDVIVVTGTPSNNGTYVISTVVGGNVITTVGALVAGEAAPNTVITAPAVDTANDKLSSVSGKKAVTGITRANFRLIAAKRGTGWRQFDFYLASAIQLLYLVEYADFYSQSMIGNGLTDWASGTWNTHNAYHAINNGGLSNGDGNVTANVSNGDGVVGSYMSYRGIENWYGHVWKFVDGFNVNNYDDNAGTAYSRVWASNTDTDFTDDTAANYTQVGDVCETDGYQNTLVQVASAFLPLTVGAGSTTKITDYYWAYFDDLSAPFDEWRVALAGAAASYGAGAGGWALLLHLASGNASADLGSRACF